MGCGRAVLIGCWAAATVLATHARAEPAGALTDLVDAAAQRLQVAEPVAASKWITHGAIEDPDRVERELGQARGEADAAGIDADYVARVFGDQINATEAIEYSRFAGWKLKPAGAPSAAPDLSASRAAIDGFNRTMLAQIVARWDLLHSPACGPELDAAKADVARVRRLDDLYQQALSLATRSYCQG
ncbi:chorismate mutase [Mycobacterium terramassiliense]|uniref:Chorismate mutase n=2 Tax=Mycobacterium terramassiliense TaxID=1841859 RepID=A0A2U3N600_9MYCO|nr:chorismate mutase [Mycobacterium terramassiliense]SPM26834.1 chorismate mutase [Mycobacterium terramassiliense]